LEDYLLFFHFSWMVGLQDRLILLEFGRVFQLRQKRLLDIETSICNRQVRLSKFRLLLEQVQS